MESPAAYPELTVRENLELVRRWRHLPHPRSVDAALDRLRLAGCAHHRAHTLSLGNAQRLGLAKALLHRPGLLILDEPANGLDPAGVVEIRDLLRRLAGTGTTVFLSSHVLAEVARLATRIGIIHHGRLLQQFPAEDLDRRVRRWLSVATRDNDHAVRALTAAGYRIAQQDGLLTTRDDRAVADRTRWRPLWWLPAARRRSCWSSRRTWRRTSSARSEPTVGDAIWAEAHKARRSRLRG